jgi:hypothetical protein
MVITIVAGASFAVGAIVPWLQPSTQERSIAATPPTSAQAPLSAQERAAPAPLPRRTGVLAIGDDIVHSASACLEERGVDVHPRSIGSVSELQAVAESSTTAYAAVLIHVERLDDLVDGHIRRALTSIPPGTRVIWGTVRLDQAPWGGYSPEDRINASVRNVVRRDSDARILDWRKATDRHPEWLDWDVGLSDAGCREYAAKVVGLSGLPRKA